MAYNTQRQNLRRWVWNCLIATSIFIDHRCDSLSKVLFNLTCMNSWWKSYCPCKSSWLVWDFLQILHKVLIIESCRKDRFQPYLRIFQITFLKFNLRNEWVSIVQHGKIIYLHISNTFCIFLQYLKCFVLFWQCNVPSFLLYGNLSLHSFRLFGFWNDHLFLVYKHCKEW